MKGCDMRPRLLIVSALVALSMALTGCGTPSNTSAADVACSDVESELAAVNSALEGTLSVIDRQTAEDDKAALEARQAECAAALPSPTETTSASAEVGNVVVVDCRDSVAHYVQLSKGFTPDQYVVGSINDTLPGATANRGGAFSSKAVTTKVELREQLNSGSPEAEAVNADVQEQVAGEGPSLESVQNVDNWVSVQYLIPVVWPENTTFVGGQAQPAGVLDNGKIGEISWIYVSEVGCELAKDTKVKTDEQVKAVVAQTASKRGACLNGKSHPVPADNYVPHPQPPPPPRPDNPPPGGLTPKDSSRDVLVNPAVPLAVRGPGTTPPGGNPGPATPPVDDSTGGAPAAPAPAPAPAPPPPPSGPGTDPGAIPEPTEPAQPAPEAPTPEDPAGGTGDDF